MPTKTLPADPENQNNERAVAAGAAVAAFALDYGETLNDSPAKRVYSPDVDAVELDDELRAQNFTDLLCNMAHWCDRHGLNVFDALRRAASHYNEETDGEGTQFRFTMTRNSEPTEDETQVEAYRAAAMELHAVEGELEIEVDAVVSIGEDGAHVAAWVFVPKPEDDEEDDDTADHPCQDCQVTVTSEDPHYSSPCGTFCSACMRKHKKACGVCKDHA